MIANLISAVAVLIAIASFIRARQADIRAMKAEAIRNLLGEKENVGFAALKLLRDGLPSNDKDRQLVIAAVMQACVFEGSDRARALLYRVIEQNRMNMRDQFRSALQAIDDTFKSMGHYNFAEEELDLSRGQRRIRAVEKVIETKTAA